MSTNDPDYLESLTSSQHEATTYLGGPALVLAGAGSGKTRVLTTRAAFLMQHQQISSEDILLATFTNKAANEMTERVFHLTQKNLKYSGTFHRLCVRILRRDGQAIGLDNNFTILDSDDQIVMMRAILKSLGYTSKEMNPNMISGMISNAKNELIMPTAYAKTAYGKYQEVVAKVYPIYERQLQEQQAVDFDNLLNKTIELFEQYPKILERWQARFQHVLVDEYQDVNKAQYLISVLLAKPLNNIFCVGDFSQNIYSWRGADYKNMLLLRDEFPTLKEFRLEQNYRSTQSILDAASAVIANNTSHPVLKLWTDKDHGESITVYEADSDRRESEFIINQLQQLTRARSFKDIAILYRTNAQSRAIEEACIRVGIPYRLIGGVRFYARKEIKDLLAYLRLYINPKEQSSFTRILKLGKRKADVFLRWNEQAKNTDLDALQILDQILEITQYKQRFNPDFNEDLDRLQNIQELRSVASEFPDLADLLENVALAENDTLPDKIKDPDQDAVFLMSLHAAKGLEFPVVFIVGMEEGLFPHTRSLMDKEQLEEERRLCYVGITRAKEKLYLSYARSRLIYGTVSGAIPSRFLSEIPEYLVDRTLGTYPRVQSSASRFDANDDAIDRFLSGELSVEDLLS